MTGSLLADAAAAGRVAVIFYAVTGVVLACIFAEGIRRRSAVLLWLAVVMSCAAWFTGPYATGPQRIGTAVAVAGCGALVVYLFSARKGVAIVSAGGALLSLLVIFLTSPAANGLYFEELAGKIRGYLMISALTFFAALWVMPRVPDQQRARAVLALVCVFAAGMLVSAFSWWFTAVEMNAYPENPVVRDLTELTAAYERTKSFPSDRGVFLTGKLAGGPAGGQAETGTRDWVAWYEYRSGPGLSPGRAPDTSFPLFADVVMEDGTICQVRMITKTNQAIHWPEGGPRMRMRALRPGDPVVVWGRPSLSTDMRTGQPHYGITETRVIAHGDPASFRTGFLLPGVTTARLFGWVGFAGMFLPFVPVLLAVRGYRRAGRLHPPGR